MSLHAFPLPALPRPSAARRRRAAGVVLLVVLAHAWLAGPWRGPAASTGQPGGRARAGLQLTHIEAVPLSAPVAQPPAAPVAVIASPAAPPAERIVRRAVPQAAPSAPAASTAAASSAASEPAPSAPEEPETEFAGAGTDRPPPLYATQLPPAVQLRYLLRRGPAQGEATLDWQPEAGRYTLQFEASLRGLWLMQQRSSGQIDANGLAPERFTDRRRGRGQPSATFDREAGRIRFSGPPVDYPAWPGAQDRLAWVVQLAGIYRAAQAAGHEPLPRVTLFVTGARGGAGLWTFELQGREAIQGPLGTVDTLYLRREPERLEDLRVEAWLDPARGHWPVRLRLTPLRGGPPLEWWLASEP